MEAYELFSILVYHSKNYLLFLQVQAFSAECFEA